MALYSIESSTLTDIGNAIRSKTNETGLILPTDMPAKIRSITTSSGDGGGGDSASSNFYVEEITYSSTTQGAYATLLTGNELVANNYNNSSLFVALIGTNVPIITDTSSLGSSVYQWYSMCAYNTAIIATSNDNWYGYGIYQTIGKSFTYPSSLQVPYSLIDTSNTNYSGLNVTSNGDVRMWVCSYDVLGPGTYKVLVGLLS